MADVTPPTDAERSRPVRSVDPASTVGSAGDRGQLYLVAAIGLGVLFVTLALLLNAAIFTENLATRESEIAGANDAGQYRQSVTGGVGGVIDHVNRNGSDDPYSPDRVDAYHRALGEFENQSARYFVVDGAAVAVAPSSSVEGTRIADDDATTALYPRDGSTADWTLVSDATVRRFSLSVATGTLPALTDGTVESVLSSGLAGTFYVELDDGSRTYRVAVYEDAGTGRPELKVYDATAGSYATCVASGPAVVVDVSRATVDGRSCGALRRISLDGSHDVRFRNGDAATGTYSLTVDRTTGPVGSTAARATYGTPCDGRATLYHDDPDAGVPFATEAIYAATVDASYHGEDVVYEAPVRAAPAEPGAPAGDPVVTTFDVADTTGGGDAAFDVSWAVTEPNGDPLTVAVEVENVDDGSVVYASSPAGASGSVSVIDPGEAGEEFRLSVVVSDGTNTRRIDERHLADGSDCP